MAVCMNGCTHNEETGTDGVAHVPAREHDRSCACIEYLANAFVMRMQAVSQLATLVLIN